MHPQLILLLAGLAAVALPASVRAERWTLERAVATALEHSPDARIARARIDAARAVADQAQAAWRPQLSVRGSYAGTDSPMMAFGSILNQRAFHFGLDFNHPGTIDNLNATGTVAYNLYSGGRATAGRTAARAGAIAADHDFQAARHQLAAEVVKAALNLHKAREAAAALESGVKAYDSAVNAARARFDAGQLLKADRLSLEVQLAQTRASLSAARHGAALAERAFRYTLGLEPADESVEFAFDDPAIAQLTPPATGDFSGRPELRGLEERAHAAEAMVTAARSGRRPSVNAFASYQYDHGWKLDRGADSWLAGVSVDLNIFDGGQTTGKIRQAAAEFTQVKEQLRKVNLGIGLEVEQARLAHANAVEQLAVTASAVEQAEESASLSRARFEREALLTADLIGAESRLLEARLRRTVAAADERIAVIELRRALGLSPIESPNP
ncbi:MAG: TolC family protein [Opitutaceae bacterium]|nr:TolC family protein [Opitutaceae bacterium]